MKIAYMDCFSGISGDMLLGACIDAGLSAKRLKNELSSLKIGKWELKVHKTKKCSITGTKVEITSLEENAHHRHLQDIEDIIEDSDLDEWVKENSIKVFRRLAKAEGEIHDQPMEKVHFHEVGAIDSIIDITGSLAALRLLEVEKIYSSKIPLGYGFVWAEHGMLPLPAPAAAELLKEIPVVYTDCNKELVTPTGAAILTTLTERFDYFPPSCWSSNGYGCGNYERENVPNMLRIFIGDTL